MSLSLPFPTEVSTSLTAEELEALKTAYETEEKSAQAKIDYAWGLIKTKPKKEEATWARILAELKLSHPEHLEAIHYYEALGHYQLGSYTQAKTLNNLVLAKDDKNIQAKALQSMIDRSVSREGACGILVTIAGIALIAGIGFAVYNRYYRY
ncbi:hypothetical protein CONCODRAFT_84751 [Conidiobolus coronatus NRRL 28638]|uniref:Mitochondrial fission 1 protein n=1 Tax=Conidiobolus coronatus (strain ATCC 28846 / CBS 209.66 / NRRL 28638) TaxID=796925 RepID=A0A137P8J9_CONC2|nr:hypothetical protein CONCODRAFT_84751 [Conidiobolus coronatus NRRL 28638]|eukprot:KXN71336.1 hypothetical protein CONCODRAFT_84751 [Conidiobolus coronatus NRRL 28638]